LRDEYGLIDGKDIHIITTPTHNNAMYSVIKGEGDAAVTGINLYLGLIKREGPVVRKIGETPKVPGFMLMARPELSSALVKALNRAAKAFSSTAAGKKYIFNGYKDIDNSTMKALDAYITNLH
jgi:ABC-type phosphate/phosphonate transport system substrate-binding protein